MEPELMHRFRTLLDGCLRCGRATSLRDCPNCGEPTTAAPADLPPPVAPLGHMIQGRLPWTRRRGVAVEVHADGVTVVRPDGGQARLPGRRFQTVEVPAGHVRVRSAPGALLAATVLELPADVRDTLRQQALAQVADSVAAQRALAGDSVALGMTDLLAELPLSDDERTWWRAMALWGGGDRTRAAAELLTLPADRYPQRLVLWWRAVAGGALPEGMRSEVAAVARGLASGSPAAGFAAALLLRELGERSGIAGDAELVDAASALCGEHIVAWLDGRRGESTAARLLGALSDRTDAAERLGDPAILDAAPPAILDDLIDRSRIPPTWVPSSAAESPVDRLACGRYVRARTCIGTLDDAALTDVGAHDERARRSVVASGRLPDDLPQAVADRYAPLHAAIGGDGDALATLGEAAGLDTTRLRATLADHATVPATQLLTDESLARWLLARSTADPAAWADEPLHQRQRRFAGMLALRRAKDQLHQWNWHGVLEAARTCLRIARSEELRDEAQNLLAAAHWQLGNDTAASAALSAALDGTYTAALQVNYAVVAAELEPQQAAAHLSRLVVEAPDLALQLSAAKLAVRLWSNDAHWQQGEPLPHDLAIALRSLATGPLDYDDFRQLVQLLANHDATWLAAPGILDRSPHRHTQAARIWTANARGPEDFVRELAGALRGSPEPWLEELRNQLVQDLIGALNPPGPDTPWGFGLLLFDHAVPVPIDMRAVLLTLTVHGALAAIDLTTAEPAAKFLDRMEHTAQQAAREAPAQREMVDAMVDAGFRALIMAYLEARRHQFGHVYQLYASIHAQVAMVPRRMRNVAAVRLAVQPGVDACDDTLRLLDRLERHAAADLIPAIADLRNQYRQLQQSFVQLSR